MRKRGIALAITLASLAAPAQTLAEKGDVYVADPGRTTIWKLAPAGGEARVLVYGLADPTGTALDRDGSLVVAAAGLDDPIYRVNRNTGAISTIVSDVYPVDVAPAADGALYATTFAGGDPGLIRVDPQTGDVEFVAGDHASSDSWSGLALTRDGTAYVADTGGVIRAIDIRDGSRRGVLSDPLLEGPTGVALTADERFLYVAGAGSNNIVRFNIRTGQATEVVSFANPLALGVSLFADGSFLVSRGDFFSPGGILNRVGPLGSPVEVFSDDSELGDPQDTVIEPKRCRGTFPTVVGTTGRDKLKGSKYADVISTLGGSDKVNAGKGKDIVCGGKGKDKLKGGKGKDKLKGGPGRDIERQ